MSENNADGFKPQVVTSALKSIQINYGELVGGVDECQTDSINVLKDKWRTKNGYAYLNGPGGIIQRLNGILENISKNLNKIFEVVNDVSVRIANESGANYEPVDFRIIEDRFVGGGSVTDSFQWDKVATDKAFTELNNFIANRIEVNISEIAETMSQLKKGLEYSEYGENICQYFDSVRSKIDLALENYRAAMKSIKADYEREASEHVANMSEVNALFDNDLDISTDLVVTDAEGNPVEI